jgi:hypothetical protein
VTLFRFPFPFPSETTEGAYEDGAYEEEEAAAVEPGVGGRGGSGTVGGGPAEAMLPQLIRLLFKLLKVRFELVILGGSPGEPVGEEVIDSAPKPARFARSAASRADAERGTLRGGVPGPVSWGDSNVISHRHRQRPLMKKMNTRRTNKGCGSRTQCAGCL